MSLPLKHKRTTAKQWREEAKIAKEAARIAAKEYWSQRTASKLAAKAAREAEPEIEW